MKCREVHTVVTVSVEFFCVRQFVEMFFLFVFLVGNFTGSGTQEFLVFGTVSAREKTSDADVPEFHRSERLTRGPHFFRSQNFSCVEAVKCLVRFCRFHFSFCVIHHRGW
jgi:hypothetical protein